MASWLGKYMDQGNCALLILYEHVRYALTSYISKSPLAWMHVVSMAKLLIVILLL